jgi:pimeloyl-ACP methyl ester carboxylesterase
VTFVRLDTVPDLFSRPQEPKKPFPYHEESVVFENRAAGVKLAGTLTRPRVEGTVPAVVLLSMSGPQDRDETAFGHKPFLVLADYLTRQGIAVLRYDDRGFGKSTGKFLGATTADFAEDARAGVAYLKTRPEIDPKKIGLLGHSEGGAVGPLLASKSTDVAFLVLLGGPAVPGAELALKQTPLYQRLFGATEKQIAFNVALQKRLIAVLNEEGDDAAAAEKIRRAIDQEWEKVAEADRPPLATMRADFQQQMIPEALPWHRFFLRHDPRPVLARVRCPVLALYAEKDCQVPPDPNAKEAEKAFRGGENKDITVKVIAGANHLFQPCRFGSIHEYCAITQTMSPEVLELITDWVKQKTGGNKLSR